MSATDSDLDFESADEDTNYDVNVTSNNTSHKILIEKNNSDSTASSLKYETIVTQSSAEKTVNLESISNKSITDADSKVAETASDSTTFVNNIEKGKALHVETESQIETTDLKETSEIGNTLISNNDSKVDVNETCVEKQRVPLRLEKKIQQKNQILKESSAEKNCCISTENSQKQNEFQSSSWGFGSWGSSLLSGAASSVSTFTNQVSQGIGTVIETVESTLGAPAPEELAATLSKERESPDAISDVEAEACSSAEERNDENNTEITSSILPDVSSWTKVIENTGSKVIMGGLDTLELIGKKTIDMITDSDPGLRKTRSVFGDGVTLSQMLREAKAEADESKQYSESTEVIHYSQLFDEYQGLVHLEALEMLSTQSQAKLQRLLMRVAKTAEVRKNMEEIKSICENIPPLDDSTDCENFEDFDTVCKKYVLELNLPFNVENLIKTQKRINDVLKNYETATGMTRTPEEIYQSAICSLAEFTAKSIETFHKMTELILVQPALEPSVEHFATNLTGLTTVMCIEINNLSSRYHHCLDSVEDQSGDNTSNNVTAIVTNLYVEASNSNKYIQDAFLLLVPVLQVSQLESSQ